MDKEVTYESLEKEFRTKVNELQDNCKHENVSDWLDYCWAPGHYSGYTVKQCLRCKKIIKEKGK